jgi:hypothetical protein
LSATHHTDEQDGDGTSKLNEDGKGPKKKKKASTTSTSRKSTKASSKSISATAKIATTPSETSPSHLKPSVITPPSNKTSSPLKATPSTHDRHGGKSPLTGKHTHTGTSTPSIQDTLPDHAITKRRSDEEISSLRYKIPKRSELSKHSLSRSDSEGKRELLRNGV